MTRRNQKPQDKRYISIKTDSHDIPFNRVEVSAYRRLCRDQNTIHVYLLYRRKYAEIKLETPFNCSFSKVAKVSLELLAHREIIEVLKHAPKIHEMVEWWVLDDSGYIKGILSSRGELVASEICDIVANGFIPREEYREIEDEIVKTIDIMREKHNDLMPYMYREINVVRAQHGFDPINPAKKIGFIGY